MDDDLRSRRQMENCDDEEKSAEKKGRWTKWKFPLTILNVVVLLTVVVAIIIYIATYPKLTYFHRHYNYSIVPSSSSNESASSSSSSSVSTASSSSSSSSSSSTTIDSNSSNCKPITIGQCIGQVPYDVYSLPVKEPVGVNDVTAANAALESYAPAIDLRCYRLLPLFLCSLYLPKCSKDGTVPPCRALCIKSKRRCEFFMGVYQLSWPETLDCDLLPESADDDVCVGQKEFLHDLSKEKECVDGVSCDNRTRCIDKRWLCDGIGDCEDGTDEHNCVECGRNKFKCQQNQCIHKSRICDGVQDCQNNKDEINCYRLSQKRGDDGIGRLDGYDIKSSTWKPVCPLGFDDKKQLAVCNALAYRKVVSSFVSKTSPSSSTVSVEWSSIDDNAVKLTPSHANKNCNSSNDQVNLHCSDPVCGVSKIPSHPVSRSIRIVGGHEVEPGSWPWLVGLHGGKEEIFFCGGVLISDSWVLSTGHCVGQQNSTEGWTLKIGDARRNAFSSFRQTRGISAVIKHPEFVSDATKLDNDLVLMKLDEPVEFNAHIRPVCLPKKRVKPRAICSMIGWGKPKEGHDVEYNMAVHRVKIPILTIETCQLWYSAKYYTLTDSMLCAGYEQGGKDACQGDSGGPLLCQDGEEENSWYVAGLASWGYGCAQPFYPGVYTNVHKFVEWIHRTIEQH